MEHGAVSLLPPLVAIVLAVLTRRVLLPLSLGVFVGAFLLTPPDAPWWSPFASFFFAVRDSITDGQWNSLENADHKLAFTFSLLLGGMVGVLEGGGAMDRFVSGIARRIKTRRGAQTMIAASGLAIFFDDYANTLVIGGTMRSTADRYRISRSKLAYLVDSTAAPVAGLAIVSTWAATEISYMSEGLRAAGVQETSAGFKLFLYSIPYRFYPWLALVFVFLIARSGRDFGPMKTAEANAVAEPVAPDASDNVPPMRHAWVPTILPILVCIATVLSVLVVTGYQSVGEKPSTISVWRYAGSVIGEGKSYWALVFGGAAGWISSLVLHRWICRLSLRVLGGSTLRGMRQILPAMAILWLAWALSAMTGAQSLDTGGYLSSLLNDSINVTVLPTVVFLLAGLMAFSTGTSWGTMAVLTPLSVTLALRLDASVAGAIGDPDGPICLATCGSVLAGAIFGDHCSPISDTTVLSSRASGCDHVQHVRTQMPYALVVGVVCILVGCVPSALGVSPWLCLAAGVVTLMITLRLVGQPEPTC